ncbi:hypothetical protein RBS60_17720 [Sinomonas sp. ASV486]|uniref:hypothetical protein n=1 Tax=Sinomonas sp. ASV486 TaxID=3051170 RepID=UPI0027DB12A8|nr:hypothetical protein [Sinomonas sp. ASV486]MDQ4492043.1 hypothetical protein [Sinomonas sp. ASV486]
MSEPLPSAHEPPDIMRIFSLDGVPAEVQSSYWISVVGGFIGVIIGIVTGITSFAFLHLLGPMWLIRMVLDVVAVAFASAQILLGVAAKQRKEWARLQLTALAAIEVALVVGIVLGGVPAGYWYGFGLTVVAAALLWLPSSNRWFGGRSAEAEAALLTDPAREIGWDQRIGDAEALPTGPPSTIGPS